MKSFKAIVATAASFVMAGCASNPVADVATNCQWVTSQTSSGVSDKANKGYNTCNTQRADYKAGYDNYMRAR